MVHGSLATKKMHFMWLECRCFHRQDAKSNQFESVDTPHQSAEAAVFLGLGSSPKLEAWRPLMNLVILPPTILPWKPSTFDHVRSTHFGALFGRCVTSDRGPFALEGPTSFDRGTNWTGRCCCQSLVALAPGWPKGRRYSESESLENGRFMGANPTSYQIKEGVGCSHISKVNLVAHVPCQSRIISHCWHFDHRWCQVDLSVRVIKEKTRALFDWLRRIRCTLLFTSVCKLMLISSSTYWFGTAWKSIGFFLCFAGAAKPVCKKKASSGRFLVLNWVYFGVPTSSQTMLSNEAMATPPRVFVARMVINPFGICTL